MSLGRCRYATNGAGRGFPVRGDLWVLIAASRGTDWAPPCLIVISALQEVDRFVTGAIHQPVFLCDAARPAAGKQIFERFGFPRTFERVSHGGLDQIEDPDCSGAFGFYPEAEVLQELRLEYSDALSRSPHRASLYVMKPRIRV